jgi:hypothetical protein
MIHWQVSAVSTWLEFAELGPVQGCRGAAAATTVVHEQLPGGGGGLSLPPSVGVQQTFCAGCYCARLGILLQVGQQMIHLGYARGALQLELGYLLEDAMSSGRFVHVV